MTSPLGDYDAIVIGSGIGGLAAASLLAHVGRARVLVLERHFKAGGFTHVFRRKGWSWDVGVHYVGEMGEGARARRLFDLASDGAVAWQRIPSPYDRFEYPGFAFEVPDDPADYQRALGDAFPAERGNLARWFRALRAAAGWGGRRIASGALPGPLGAALRWPGSAGALRTTREVVERTFRDPLLRAVVTSQWGDYGLPPSLSAFAIHALVATHYFGGGYYPVGGAGVIAPALLARVEAAGGACLLNHEVTEVLLERGRVAGVRAVAREGGQAREVVFRAPQVISDVGVAATYGRLLRREVPAVARRSGASVVTAYLGLRDSPAKLGFTGGNHWIYEHADHEVAWAARGGVAEGRPAAAYLSFPSLRDPAARAHTAELLAITDEAPFAAWREAPWMKRGDGYEALKRRIAGGLIDLVDRRHPGFRDLVAYAELSTPLTVEHFTAHPGGQIYGSPATPERYRDPAHAVRTPIPGLFLAGADAGSLGVVGAFMGGVMAAGAAIGPLGMPRLFQAAARARGRARPAAAAAAPVALVDTALRRG